jgi:RNA polymerase sigma factor (sigma-70 family)
VTATTGVLEERDDAALIAAVRRGDTDAYGVLFERHVDAARRLARSLAHGGDADDLVAEAFAKVLPVLVRGDGPDVAFRPYLLTAVRRLDVDRHRSLARTRPTDDETVLDAALPFGDAPAETALAGFESGAAARAFASLPERWQLVLWHTEVEGQRPADVAPLLGLTPNAVSQLAHRAREGLREAFVSMHVQDSGESPAACQATRANLGAYIRGGLSNRDAARVSAHLECCRPCTGIYLELVEVDSDLRGLLAPLLLGGAATAYLSHVPVTAAPAALTSLAAFLRTGPGKVLSGTAAAGLTVTGLVLGGGALMHQDRSDRVVADPPAARTAPARPGGHSSKADHRPRHHPAPSRTPSTSGADTTSPAPVEQPSGQPSEQPSEQPTHVAADPAVPGHGSGHDDGGGHGDGDGTVVPPDPHQVDMGVSASRSGPGTASVVTVTVRGLAAGQAGLVTLTADRLAATLDLDPRCDLIGVSRATCRLNGGGDLRLIAVSVPLVPTTLTITATPADGLTDPAMDDNTASVVLG